MYLTSISLDLCSLILLSLFLHLIYLEIKDE